MYRFSKSGYLIAVLVILALILACKGDSGPAGPAGRTMVDIFGYASDEGSPVDSGRVAIMISGSSNIPTVQINSTGVEYRFQSNYYYSNAFPIGAGDTANLSVSFKNHEGVDGAAYSALILPSHFEINSHDTSVAVEQALGTPLTVTWTPSSNVAHYYVYLDYYYNYLDQNDTIRYFSRSVDTLLTVQTILFPSSLLFPNRSNIQRLVSGWGHVDIQAFSGPIHEQDISNITGDGTGIFNGITYGGELELHFGGTMVKSEPRPAHPDIDFNQVLRKFRSE